MNARQPPKAEMSRAPCVAAASARKPLSLRPSASVSVPIERGGGTLATQRPDPGAGGAPRGTAADEPGLCGRARQQDQAIVLRRRALLQKARAAGSELAVERHAGEMRADDGEGDFAVGGKRRYRRERRLRLAGGAERQRGIGGGRAAGRRRRRALAGWPDAP